MFGRRQAIRLPLSVQRAGTSGGLANCWSQRRAIRRRTWRDWLRLPGSMPGEGQNPTMSKPDNGDGRQPGHYTEYEFGVGRLDRIKNLNVKVRLCFVVKPRRDMPLGVGEVERDFRYSSILSGVSKVIRCGRCYRPPWGCSSSLPRAPSSLPSNLCRTVVQDSGEPWTPSHSESASLRHPGHAPTIMIAKGN